jgi:hypothetical protein
MGSMFKKAEKRGAKFALILGEDELNKGVAQLKNLKTKEQKEISLRIWAKNSTISLPNEDDDGCGAEEPGMTIRKIRKRALMKEGCACSDAFWKRRRERQ